SAVAKAAAAISAGAKWEDVTLPTLSGQPQALKRMRIETKIPVPDAKGKIRSIDCRIDIYEIDAGSNAVLVAWMTPKGQAQKHNLERAIEASMGTVEVAAPPAEAEGGKAAGGPGGKAATGCF